jgi:hypothetical protein
MDFNSQNNQGKAKPNFPGLPTPPGKPVQGLPKPPASVGKSLPTPPGSTGLPKLPQQPVTQQAPQQYNPQPTQQPVYNPAPQQYTQQTNHQQDFGLEEETNYFEEPQEEKRNSRPQKRTNGPRTKAARPDKKENLKGKDKKPSAYSGKRKNVVLARVLIFGIVGALMVAGVTSFLPKASGLTASDGPLILSKVRENLNVTDFPRTQGEGVALSFTQAYLNYDPVTKNARYDSLKAYVAEDILTQIEPRVATAEEISQAQSDTATVDEEGTDSDDGTGQADDGSGAGEGTGIQNITEGPYLIDSLMFKGGNAALFTTMTKVNNSNWIYLEIPMYYDDKTGAMSVSGSLTFGSPVTTAKVPEREYSSSWTNDREIETAIKSDIANYIKAWTDSDTAGLERYLVKDSGKVVATEEAQSGLGGTVKFVSVNSLSVEGKQKPEAGATAAQTADYQTREAEVKVTMLEPSSNLIYTVTYRLVLKYVNQDWFVEDIKNVSALLDRDEIISKKTSDETKQE